MSKKKDTSKVTILDTVPERLVEWEKDSEKKIAVLLVPRFRKGFLKKWLQPRVKRPYIRLSLDDIGSCVWENCDGKRTVREIGKVVEDTFGERVKPVDNRITYFFNTLYKSQFVRYWQTEETSGKCE
jgi:hypothetical protein